MLTEFSAKARSLKLTIVVDNNVDIFLPAREGIAYPKPGMHSTLLAEQGLSVSVEAVDERGETTRILYDFGRGGLVLRKNLEVLGIDPRAVDTLVLSHGHIDHYGGLVPLLRENELHAPLKVHPRAFGARGITLPNGQLGATWQLPEEELGKLLAERITSTDASVPVGPGVRTSGTIPRVSDLEPLFAAGVRVENGIPVPDDFQDDTALFCAVERQGLVVLTGCCHAGLINTLEAARRLFPEEPLLAVIGGFHFNFLNGSQLDKVVETLVSYDPRLVVPLHCTGAVATHRLLNVFRDRFAYGTTGMTLSFGAGK